MLSRNCSLSDLRTMLSYRHAGGLLGQCELLSLLSSIFVFQAVFVIKRMPREHMCVINHFREPVMVFSKCPALTLLDLQEKTKANK